MTKRANFNELFARLCEKYVLLTQWRFGRGESFLLYTGTRLMNPFYNY